MQLGFLGLGIMGYPMARHLLEAGHDVALWSHTSSKAADLASKQKKGKACTTPKQVAENADIIYLCVGDTKMSEAVTFGADGLIEGIRKDAVVVDCSTIAPSYARSASERLAQKGAHFIDAPCTGSKAGAEGGTGLGASVG